MSDKTYVALTKKQILLYNKLVNDLKKKFEAAGFSIKGFSCTAQRQSIKEKAC